MITGARIRVGAHTVEIVADGTAAYSVSDVFPDVEPTLLASVLEGRLNADGSLPLPYDPLLVRTADGPILVDAGAGEELAREWGDPVGRTQASLAAAGVAPEEIMMVLITHAHGDHVGGLTVERGGERRPRYPNARHVLSAVEWGFWIESELEPGMFTSLAAPARMHLPPLRRAGLLELIDGEAEVAPGVRLIPAPGHTPGHLAIAIEAGDAELLAVGDAILHEWSFEHPDWTAVVEWDRAAVVDTRLRLLGRAARRGSLLHAFHLAELGRVEAEGDAFRFLRESAQ